MDDEPTLDQNSAERPAFGAPKVGDMVYGIFDGQIVHVAVESITPGQDGQRLYRIGDGKRYKDVPERVLLPEIQSDLGKRKVKQELGEETLEESGVQEPAPELSEDPLTAAERLEAGKYDDLLNGTAEFGSVEDAAVRPAEDDGARLARERQRDDQMVWDENVHKARRDGEM